MRSPSGRYAALTQRLVDSVLTTPGQTTSELRGAVLERGKVPAPLASYVDKVFEHAHRVTDADVAGLAPAGYSEDAVFELTVAAAVGAALERLERGLAALRASPPGEPR
jgi:alkylhydroperoxidase family enzyme